MIDSFGRRWKDRVLAPIVGRIPSFVTPTAITTVALVFGLAAALTAGFSLWSVALVLFGINRVLDGLDGLVARFREVSSDLGGYLDIVFDFLVYATLPIGVWIGSRELYPEFLTRSELPLGATALVALLASFYLNAVSWIYLSAIQEKRGGDVAAMTTVAMPSGLIEGTETLVFFTLFLLIPRYAPLLFFAMAAGTIVGSVQRVIWAIANLRPPTNPRR